MDIEEEKKVLLESNRRKCKKFYGDAWETLDQHQKTDCIDNPREHINPKGDSPPQDSAKKKLSRKAKIRQLHRRDKKIDRLTGPPPPADPLRPPREPAKPAAGEAETRCKEFYGDKWDDLDPDLKKNCLGDFRAHFGWKGTSRRGTPCAKDGRRVLDLDGVPCDMVIDNSPAAKYSDSVARAPKKVFSFEIPGPGFDEPLGNPKGRKKSKFMVTRRKKYFGDVSGDFRVYEQKLLEVGIDSFDAFYKALIDCFGEKWLPATGLQKYGMDYKFRDEHEGAFKMWLANKEQDKCPKKTGKAPIKPGKPEAPAKPEEVEFDFEDDPGVVTPPDNVLLTSPLHASCRIHEASNTLTYGEHDPLGIYGSKIRVKKVNLNETINEIFGYSGGWREYKEKNLKDLKKKTIILKGDGRRVEFDKPQDYTYEKGDRVVQSATLWPFHIYFATLEFSEATRNEKENNYVATLHFGTKKGQEYYKKFPKLFKSLVRASSDEEKEKLAKMHENYEQDFLSHVTVFDENDPNFERITKRLALLGIDGLWGKSDADGNKIPTGHRSPYFRAVFNPPEGIVNKDVIRRVMRKLREAREKGLGEPGRNKYNVKSTKTGNPLFIHESTFEKGPAFDKKFSRFAEGEGFSPWEQAVGLGSPLIAISPPTNLFLPHRALIVDPEANPKWKEAEGPSTTAFEGAIILLMPQKSEAFTPAEKIFFKRLGINENSTLRYNPFTNKYNTESGTVDTGSMAIVRPGQFKDTEDDVDRRVEGEYDIDDLPAELKDENQPIEELIKRKNKLCKALKKSGKDAWFCQPWVDEETFKMFLGREGPPDAPKKPTPEEPPTKAKTSEQTKAAITRAAKITELPEAWMAGMIANESTGNCNVRAYNGNYLLRVMKKHHKKDGEYTKENIKALREIDRLQRKAGKKRILSRVYGDHKHKVFEQAWDIVPKAAMRVTAWGTYQVLGHSFLDLTKQDAFKAWEMWQSEDRCKISAQLLKIWTNTGKYGGGRRFKRNVKRAAKRGTTVYQWYISVAPYFGGGPPRENWRKKGCKNDPNLTKKQRKRCQPESTDWTEKVDRKGRKKVVANDGGMWITDTRGVYGKAGQKYWISTLNYAIKARHYGMRYLRSEKRSAKKKSTKKKDVMIFGHSQAGKWSQGGAVAKKLKEAGFTVARIAHGGNDDIDLKDKLRGAIKKHKPSHLVLHLGGNYAKRGKGRRVLTKQLKALETMAKIISDEGFSPENVHIIPPPINLRRRKGEKQNPEYWKKRISPAAEGEDPELSEKSVVHTWARANKYYLYPSIIEWGGRGPLKGKGWERKGGGMHMKSNHPKILAIGGKIAERVKKHTSVQEAKDSNMHNFVENSLNAIIKEINEGKVNELENQAL